nr:HAD family hydrolase [Rhodoferax sp.]
MTKPIIALDADGVLLDYSVEYATVWQRAFREYPTEKDPKAYWAADRWNVERLVGERLEHFLGHFEETFWESLLALPGASKACRDLHAAGYELVCVTAMPEQFASARQRNFHRMGFPIDKVIATGKFAEGKSPKADVLNALRPCAFVDDYLPYMAGVHPDIHPALITRDPNGSPNFGDALRHVSSQHNTLAEFSRWWLAQTGLPRN